VQGSIVWLLNFLGHLGLPKVWMRPKLLLGAPLPWSWHVNEWNVCVFGWWRLVVKE